MTIQAPLDPFSFVVTPERKFTVEWYEWLLKLVTEADTFVLAKGAAYTVTPGDRNKLILLENASGYTLTFGPASGYADYHFNFVLSTIAPNKTIAPDGIASSALPAGQLAAVVKTSAGAWQTFLF